MSTVRLRRLQSDYQRLQNYVRLQPRVELLQSEGDPPERYQLNFRVKGLRKKGDTILTATGHLVEIALPRDYPRLPPQWRSVSFNVRWRGRQVQIRITGTAVRVVVPDGQPMDIRIADGVRKVDAGAALEVTLEP